MKTLLLTLCLLTAAAHAQDAALIAKAQAGDPQAQNELGLQYSNNKDYAKAKEWYEKAAMQGDVAAHHNLGISFLILA